jgi:hypothetical protein
MAEPDHLEPKLGDIVLYKPDTDSYADEDELWPAIVIKIHQAQSEAVSVDLTAFRRVGGTTSRNFVREGLAAGQWRRR